MGIRARRAGQHSPRCPASSASARVPRRLDRAWSNSPSRDDVVRCMALSWGMGTSSGSRDCDGSARRGGCARLGSRKSVGVDSTPMAWEAFIFVVPLALADPGRGTSALAFHWSGGEARGRDGSARRCGVELRPGRESNPFPSLSRRPTSCIARPCGSLVGRRYRDRVERASLRPHRQQGPGPKTIRVRRVGPLGFVQGQVYRAPGRGGSEGVRLRRLVLAGHGRAQGDSRGALVRGHAADCRG